MTACVGAIRDAIEKLISASVGGCGRFNLPNGASDRTISPEDRRFSV